MEYVADLHLHSKYSRAVSRDMVLPVMAKWAKQKGLDILTTTDWTHPLWFREIRLLLEESSNGIFKLKDKSSDTLFVLSVEISSIYSQGGKVRRIHNLIFSPSFETAEKISKELVRRGCNLGSDGRPIIGLSSIQLLELVLSIDKRVLLVPCHVWTPWFSLYGSNSGFDSIEECFGEYAKYIYGVETGLSSDPFMNWQIKELDNRTILSSSDAHSPAKMGREATVFKSKTDKKITYGDIIAAIKKEKDRNLDISYTIEFYPEEGKYHYSGHRNCKVVQKPSDTKSSGRICPVCKKPLTIGVMHRVEDLAREGTDFNSEIAKVNSNGVKWMIDPTKKHPPFVKLVPLLEIAAESLHSTVSSLKSKALFDELCNKFTSEINVLLKTPIEDIKREAGDKVAEGVLKVRQGNIVIDPGYDGVYGVVKIWNEDEPSIQVKVKAENQLGLDF